MFLTSTVLRLRPHRENDKLFTAYTRERGKLTLLGGGMAKITSKLAGHLGPLIISELRTVPGRMWEKITGAEGIETFPRIASSLPRVGSAFSILELVDALTKENHPDPKLWELLIASLRDCNDGGDPQRIQSSFAARALAILGERPPLEAHVTAPLTSPRWAQWAQAI
jgi:DNA repair protein RecO (recombination protein O)